MTKPIARELQRFVAMFEGYAWGGHSLAQVRDDLDDLLAIARADLSALQPNYRGQHEEKKARALARLAKRRAR